MDSHLLLKKENEKIIQLCLFYNVHYYLLDNN